MKVNQLRRISLLLALSSSTLIASPKEHTQQPQFTLISKTQYHQVSQASRRQTQSLINQLSLLKTPSYLNHLVIDATQFFLNTPYKGPHADGEGNWCSGDIDTHHCPHIQQDPIYRTDQFVCSTYVSQVLALINAKNINQYEKNLLSIKYGAADQPASTITYYNRNNFISTDFNRINENNGLLTNAMTSKNLKPLTDIVSVNINHHNWFLHQQQGSKLRKNIRVFSPAIGKRMRRLFNGNYPAIPHQLKTQQIHFRYIPKQALFLTNKSQQPYQANTNVLKRLPTPSVVEITRDDSRWLIHHRPISTIIGSGIAVSHLGLLYRKHYQQHQLIYPQLTCGTTHNLPTCEVKSIYCQKSDGCTKLMFTNATDAYPNNYYFYQKTNGDYACSKYKPKHFKGNIQHCNRVVTMPLTDYLTQKENGKYRYMDNPSILGIHLEKINVISLWKNFK